MEILTFKPKDINKILTASLKGRTKDIVLRRFGIGTSPERKTLEAIGQDYGITRERVRQIENFALNSIKQSENFSSVNEVFDELGDIISQRGWLVSEQDIFDYLASDARSKNHLHFLLVVGNDFTKMKEDGEFHHRWTTDELKAKKINDALKKLHKTINKEDLMQEDEIISKLKKYAEDALEEKIKEDVIRLWFGISKTIGRNAFGEWGNVTSASIRPRGMRDLAILVLRKQGSPMHFTEVAGTITDLFKRGAHPATVHNELIKDDRFVLVGRGVYALREWGYSAGTVRDIIKNILKSSGPITKEDLVSRVLKERYVKESTILVNLQNRKNFKRNKQGNYGIL